MSKLQEIKTAIEAGKSKVIVDLVNEAIAEGVSPSDILNDGMIDAMSAIGERFSNGVIFVPEMLISARTMKKGVEALKPHMAAGAAGANGKVVLGTVAGDLHDIGKNLVGMMIESAGFEVIDLGVDVSTDRFIAAVKESPDVKIVALSALLTTSMPAMQDTVKALLAIDNRNFKILVGGAPITAEFAKSIGADAYSSDAASAAATAKTLIA